jgi:hypothetical protein
MTLKFEEINKTHTKTINGTKIVFKPSDTPPEKWDNYYQHFPELFEVSKPIRYEAIEHKPKKKRKNDRRNTGTDS